MTRRLTLMALVLALLGPATASAVPIARVDSPVNGECIGGTFYPSRGQATWQHTPNQTDGRWTWRALNGEGQLLQTRTGTTPTTGISFDTTTLPLAPFKMTLDVEEFASGLSAHAERVVDPVFDRAKPTRPDTNGVIAVSSGQAWVRFTNAADAGCSGLDHYELVAYDSASRAYPLTQVDQQAVRLGADHEALSEPYALPAGIALRATVRAIDRFGNSSTWGTNTTFTTRSDFRTVLAGQVTNTYGNPVNGVRVTATKTSGQFLPQVQSSGTDANGIYGALLYDPGEASSGWNVRYERGCTLPPPLCPAPFPAAVESVTTPDRPGLLLVHNKTIGG